MKVAFFGNCQLEQLQAVFALPHFQPDLAVTQIPPIHKIKAEQYEAFRRAVAELDVLYLHYTSERYGVFSTENILSLVGARARMLPNLECRAWTPQIGYFADDVTLPRTDYVDYVVLSLFLAGLAPAEAAAAYGRARANPQAAAALLASERERHRQLHAAGKVVFDYSPRLAGPFGERLFWTFNHPARPEMEWLINRVLADLGVDRPIKLGRDLLDGNRAAVVAGVAAGLGYERTAEDEVFMVFGRRLSALDYVSLHYEGYAELERDFLQAQLAASLWAGLAEPSAPA